ncbi:hypothetical protein MRB53_029456 [Persea americana]|uniref:Uncharacterized protein n=1 Tax=Persea americana TaxID=3435 RepID=A0ACC2KJI8_PERAE|nr:hypothetical protein MRB53_029456 [Persea americana]
MAMAENVEMQEGGKAFGVPWADLNDGLTYSDFVRPIHSGSTLIEFYSSNHNNSAPLQGWLQRIQNGQITLDGQVVTDPDTILRDGSELLYCRLPWKEPCAPFLLEVLFEDDDMVALNKPSGLQVLPGGLFQQRTVLTQLQWRPEKPNSSRAAAQKSHPVPVHRLGRGTSGILLCAKSKVAKARLAEYFADGTAIVKKNRDTDMEFGITRRILKLYRALATGIIDEDEVVIKQPIGIMHYPGVAKGLYVASSSGKPALSKVTILERDLQENRTLVQVEIHSGRPHQIRIHLAFIGHPLLGDPLYAIGGHPKFVELGPSDDSFAQDGGYQRPTRPVPGDCGYHLHAHRLVLRHPAHSEVIEITAPLPPMLQTQEESHPSTAAGILASSSAEEVVSINEEE